jgi:hypothetical protein
MKAVVALAMIGVSAAIAACGSGGAVQPSAPGSAQPSDPGSAQSFAVSIADQVAASGDTRDAQGTPVRYHTIEYSTAVGDTGTPVAFAAFITVSRTITVQTSSAASVTTTDNGVLIFTTPSDRAHWVAAGRPALEPVSGQTVTVPPGQFSFIPQGSTMTYQQAAALPGTADTLSAQVLSYLRPYAGSAPPATVVLRLLGNLIAVAPLTAATRSAAWRVAASLPGLRLCGSGTDLSGRGGLGICVDADGEETEVLVSTQARSVLAVQERLMRPSAAYPTVPAGSLIASTTFITS